MPAPTAPGPTQLATVTHVASLETLRPGQRSMLQLLIRHGRTYESLAQTFQTTPERVRERAYEAVDELAPGRGAPDPAWQERVTDYLLGQLAPDQVTGVREQLDRSSAGREWAAVVVDALDPLYPLDTRPALPGVEHGQASASVPVGTQHQAPGKGVTPWHSADPSQARRAPRIAAARPAAAKQRGAPWIALLLGLLAGAAGLAALLLARSGGDAAPTGGADPLRVERQAVMRPPAGAGGGGGIAVIGRRGPRPQLLMQARLERPARGAAHELWLYRSPRDARSLGVVRVDRRGNLRAAAPLPADFTSYRAIDLSRERDGDPRHSGRSLLRARLPGPM